MKTQNEKTAEVLQGGQKGIFSQLVYWTNNRDRNDNLIGDTLIELISQNGTGLNKLVALNCIENDINPTKQEAIDLTYEISNNLDTYLIEFEVYKNSGKNDALEVLREIYPSKSDAELKLMIR